MRKIYLVFVLIFGLFIALELNFTPTQKERTPFARPNTTHILPAEIQQSSLFAFESTLSDGFSTESKAVNDILTWNLLGEINYQNKPHKDYPDGVMYPVINQQLKTKQGNKITISGFIIPIDNTSYALSKNVFAQCFFCGQAGPETIMGIQFKNLRNRLKTDQYVTLEGTFRYNETDIEDWIYHIDDAVIVKGG